MSKLRVLIRLLHGYGLGDTIQTTVVLKHIRKYRPNWIVDYQCGWTGERAAVNIVNQVFADDQPNPNQYDKIIEIQPLDNFMNFTDQPNTKTTAMLKDFGIPYDLSLGRYEFPISVPVQSKANRLLRDAGVEQDQKWRAVILHYEGHGSRARKSLQHWQAQDIIDAIRQTGRVPVVLDHERTAVVKNATCLYPEGAETVAALINACEAFIGVDSAPAHIASATETPTLVCWTKHHPMQFHDPAPNTLHLVPDTHHSMYPVVDPDIMAWFHEHYLYCTYTGENGLVANAIEWLIETLKSPMADFGIKFVVPDCTRAGAWVMAKIRNIAMKRPIDIFVTAERWEGEQTKAFYRQFPCVRNVNTTSLSCHVAPEKPQNTRGHYLYVPDGRRNGYHFLVPPAAWQQGYTLEQWLPEVPLDDEMAMELRYGGWL
jgi:ADP-heptose:LPS heptosyltransferase